MTPPIEQLYRRHGHSVLRRASQLLGDEQEALDVLQEVFASLLQRPEQFAGRSSITTWLYSATTHRCLNRLRDGRTRARLLRENAADQRSAEAPRAEQASIAQQLLGRMPEELAQVAVYYYLDQMTHDEIAEVVGCSRRQVGNLLERVRDFAKAAR